MSHGAGAGDIRAEPDLTPMLDLVMQLLMYFIMCVNFIGEEVNENVQLPPAQAARPIDKSEGDVLFVNVNKDGKNHTAIILRADKDATYEAVYKVMHLCKEEKFNQFKLHAIKKD